MEEILEDTAIAVTISLSGVPERRFIRRIVSRG
jgi:hypothetical protein